MNPQRLLGLFFKQVKKSFMTYFNVAIYFLNIILNHLDDTKACRSLLLVGLDPPNGSIRMRH